MQLEFGLVMQTNLERDPSGFSKFFTRCVGRGTGEENISLNLSRGKRNSQMIAQGQESDLVLTGRTTA